MKLILTRYISGNQIRRYEVEIMFSFWQFEFPLNKYSRVQKKELTLYFRDILETNLPCRCQGIQIAETIATSLIVG